MIRKLKRASKHNSYWHRDARYEQRHGPGVPYHSSFRRHGARKPGLGLYMRLGDGGRRRRPSMKRY